MSYRGMSQRHVAKCYVDIEHTPLPSQLMSQMYTFLQMRLCLLVTHNFARWTYTMSERSAESECAVARTFYRKRQQTFKAFLSGTHSSFCVILRNFCVVADDDDDDISERHAERAKCTRTFISVQPLFASSRYHCKQKSVLMNEN